MKSVFITFDQVLAASAGTWQQDGRAALWQSRMAQYVLCYYYYCRRS